MHVESQRSLEISSNLKIMPRVYTTVDSLLEKVSSHAGFSFPNEMPVKSC